MKNITIASFLLFSVTLFAQNETSNRSRYQSIGASFSSYSKPRANEIANGFYSTPEMYDDVKRNLGVSVQYSQMNFWGKSGIEYGIGVDLMFINNNYNIQYLDSVENYDIKVVQLGPVRTNVAMVNLPLHYVQKIDLGERFTLFPKIGVNAKLLVHTNSSGFGQGFYKDESFNLVTADVNYTTYNNMTNYSLNNLLLNGTVGASLGWKMKNEDLLSFNVMFSGQLLKNSILSRITDIKYTKDDVVHFDSENFYPTHYYNGGQLVINGTTSAGWHIAEHKISNIAVGISYIFGGNNQKMK